MRCPRVLIAGTSSGCGKTTAVCALLKLLRERAPGVSALKCGPDYIDPMFHREALGIPSGNLDPFFCTDSLLRSTLTARAGRDITVIEGVMGYYDGAGQDGTDNSTYTVARAVSAPVILTVNARGTCASALAVLEGFSRFYPDSGIRGVIFNGVVRATYERLRDLTLSRFAGSILPLGYIPKLPENCLFPSRHLGLVTPEDSQSIAQKLDALGEICRDTLDIDGVFSLAASAPEIKAEPRTIPSLPPVTVAVARDAAFSFIYPDTLELFRSMGAKVEFFSPLSDEPVPSGAAGLYLPGGYPELYADTLEKNRAAVESVRRAVLSGMPTVAECGGFQYLGSRLVGRRMCGVLPQESFNAGHLVRFGYVTLTSKRDGLFGPAGTVLPAHEFHYYDSTETGGGFTAQKLSGSRWDCAFYTPTLYAGYPHLYLPANIPAAESFLKKCAEYAEYKECSKCL